MQDEQRDHELDWLKKLNDKPGMSLRDIGRMLGVHHETVNRAIKEGTMSDSLRSAVRKQMEATTPVVKDGASGGAGTRKSQSTRRRNRRTYEERVERRERAARRSLLDEIVECDTVKQAAGITARIRGRQLEAAYEKRQIQPFSGYMPISITPFYLYPRAATLDELKIHAIALLLGIPVLKELPLDIAANAARAVLDGEASLLNPPAGVYGDALVLLLTRAEAHYWDPGAREVAIAHAGRLYPCGLSAEDIRDGVLIEDRMRRYACDHHFNRPLMIGTRFSDVILAEAYRHEDWFFGSSGWVDEDGVSRPSRGEIIAGWRHVSGLCDAWGNEDPATPWQLALNEQKLSLEVILLGPGYGMTFARDILGEARWPTSTRMGQQTQVGLSLMKELSRSVQKLRRHRRLRALLLWLPRLPLRGLRKLVFVLRRDLAVYVEKQDRPKGKERLRQLLSLFFMRPPYDKENPPATPPRIREGIMPALYEPVSDQRWPTKIVSWLLYRRHSDLDGSVCGLSDWTAADPPMTPEYMTPNPRSGYVPSRAFRLRFRAHEFEPGYRAPAPREQSRRWLAKALRGVGRLVGRRVAA